MLDRKSEENSEIFSAFDELRDSPVLSQQEKTLDRLSDEGTLMIMAGMRSYQNALMLFPVALMNSRHRVTSKINGYSCLLPLGQSAHASQSP